MALLVLGLVLFLGIHSVRIVADGARGRFIAARGKMA
ncbi:MAG TPA: NnrU family protein, partial [Burkholderiaceae bacterium]|nr:NnrU family protein [Burkholderiaceae bacterium]